MKKRMSKLRLFGLIFAICSLLILLPYGFMGVEIKAAEGDYWDYVDEEEGQKIHIELIDDIKAKVVLTNLNTGDSSEDQLNYQIENDKLILFTTDVKKGVAFRIDSENHTAIEWVDAPPLTKDDLQELEEMIIDPMSLKIESWITSFLVSLLGSGAFFGVIRMVLNKIIKALKKKIEELEKQNKITAEQRDEAIKRAEMLDAKFDDAINYVKSLAEIVKENKSVDMAKVQKCDELLDKIFGKAKNNEDTLDEIKEKLN